MNVPGRWVGLASSAALGLLFVTAIAVQAVAIAQSWGARYWLFGGSAAAVVCLLALLRHRHLVGTAVAGLAIGAVAVGAAHVAQLPAEPGPALAMGLAVLVGSAIRALPPSPAAVIAAAALAVVAGSHLAGRPSAAGISAATVIGSVAWLTAVAVGLALRLLDRRARAVAAHVRQAERLELARELHDLVAHHITAILVQAQAAQIVARRSPEKTAESLAGIEDAGTSAQSRGDQLRPAGDRPTPHGAIISPECHQMRTGGCCGRDHHSQPFRGNSPCPQSPCGRTPSQYRS